MFRMVVPDLPRRATLDVVGLELPREVAARSHVENRVDCLPVQRGEIVDMEREFADVLSVTNRELVARKTPFLFRRTGPVNVLSGSPSCP